jgi:hypothetical protein
MPTWSDKTHRLRFLCAAALAVAAVAMTGCRTTPRPPAAMPVQTTTVEPAVSMLVVRTIPNVDLCVASPSGGPLAYSVVDANGNERAFILRSWDATPAVSIGATSSGVFLSASREGVYVQEHDGIGYVTWEGTRETTLSALAHTAFFYASPSGTRLLVDWGNSRGKPPFGIIDRTRGYVERAWAFPKAIGGAAWLSDTQFLVQLDSRTDQGSGHIYLVTTAPGGRVASTKKTGLIGSCPAASPDGATWAYFDGGFVLYDPVRRREIARWLAPQWSDGGRYEWQPTWCDATHVAISTRSGDGQLSLWVLDVSRPLGQYSSEQR